MIKLDSEKTKIKEFSKPPKSEVKVEAAQPEQPAKTVAAFTSAVDEPFAFIRPECVDAKVYKLKSAFVKNSVFITLGFYNEHGRKRPIEIFINSKDLSRAPEYVVLTRLISAIFRRSPNPYFILEELRGIFDPSGGSFKGGKYYHSFYAEIADVIEQFFYDVGILDRPDPRPVSDNGSMPADNSHQTQSQHQRPPVFNNDEGNGGMTRFKICPECGNKTLKLENGCDICMDPSCGYSKCDK